MMIPLHLPSHWSPGHGASSLADLVGRAARWSVPALALTDLENLCGVVEFHHRCRASGIRPILGVELRRGFASAGARGRRGARAGRLVLLARNAAGYRSLCRIVSRRHAGEFGALTGDPVPDVLAEPEGLFVLSDDPRPLERLLQGGFPPAWLRVLLVRPCRSAPAETAVLRAARRLGLLLLADLDPVGLDPEDEIPLRLARSLRQGVSRNALPPERFRRLLSPSHAAALYADRPEAISETARVAEACADGILPWAPVFPTSGLGPGETPGARLALRAQAELDRARGDGRLRGDRYERRLDRELAVIEATGLASWFLGIDEVVRSARRRRIEIVSRGSAVGSLVVHLLGAGPVDPVEGGLLFERFLRPGRSSPPDVDFDVPSRRRGEVIEWVLSRWAGRAAAVGAHQRFGRRSAHRETLRALGLGSDVPGDRLPTGWDRLIGAPRGLSIHPGGVIVAADPIIDLVPLETAPKGVPVTQLDGRSLDALGIVKLDFLGNTCLDEIDRAIQLISRRETALARALAERGSAAIPLDDPPTLRRLDAGDTIGCSQIETPATRAALRRAGIASIDDLTAALAAVRPGPGGGHIVFEEDVMRGLSAAARITLEEADAWRARIVATDEDPAALERLERSFLRRSVGRGAEPRAAGNAWSAAASFARYAFSKAHASSAALLAYRAAFLRTRFAREYGCAVLDDHGGAYPCRTIAAEVGRWGPTIRPPAVNRSEARTSLLAADDILLGLDRVRGLTARSRRAILEAREREGAFRSLADLLERAPMAITEIEALVRSGSCDALAPLSAEGYPFVHESVLDALRSGSAPRPIGALRWRLPLEPDPGSRSRLERYRSLVRARNELRYLGSTPSGHPLAILRDQASEAGCRTIANILASAERFQDVRLAALPAATRLVETPRGAMRFVTWEDETGLLEGELLPRDYARLSPRFDAAGAYQIEGLLRRGDSGPRLRVLELRALLAERRPRDAARAVRRRTEPGRSRR